MESIRELSTSYNTWHVLYKIWYDMERKRYGLDGCIKMA